jgi:mannose-1-phosphate guanylyltransferase
MGQSGAATPFNTNAVAWTVIVAGPAAALAVALDHAGRVSPPERTLVVITARRPIGLDALPPGRAHVLVEPLDRGTAAAILLPVHWIRAIDPDATVVVLGDDLPASRHGIADGIAQATQLVDRDPEALVLLGLASGRREPGRVVIVPGERIGPAVGARLFRVADLIDPDPRGDARPRAGELCHAGVFIGRATAFIGATSEHAASMNDRLARATTFAGQEHERWALRQAYALAPRMELFRSALRPIARALTVLEIQDIGGGYDRDEEPALDVGGLLPFGAWSTASAPG